MPLNKKSKRNQNNTYINFTDVLAIKTIHTHTHTDIHTHTHTHKHSHTHTHIYIYIYTLSW